MSIFNKENIYYQMYNYYSMNYKSYNMNFHSHAASEIMYVKEGNCSVYINIDNNHSGNKEKVNLRAGQFIFIDQNIEHKLHIDSITPCKLMNIEYHAGNKKETLRIDISEAKENVPSLKIFFDNPAIYICLQDDGSVCDAMNDLLCELEKYKNTNKDYYYLENLLFIRFMIEFARLRENNTKDTDLIYIKKAKEFLIENIKNNPSLNDVAEYAGICHTYVYKLFKQHLDMGFSDYKNMLKLQNAEYLLRNTEMKIKDIANDSGYNNRQHFGRIFVQKYKTNPKEYRILYSVKNNKKASVKFKKEEKPY